MIYFDNVTKIYSDDTVALENVDLKIEPGEFVSIVLWSFEICFLTVS